MHIEHSNQPIFALDDTHPAKKFLIAFIECRENCVGRHHDWTGVTPIEQGWVSSEGKAWLFSQFAYMFLSFDLELDGFLEHAVQPTESETAALHNIPLMRSLMEECTVAARRDDNAEMLKLTAQVLEMLRLWEEYLRYRGSVA